MPAVCSWPNPARPHRNALASVNTKHTEARAEIKMMNRLWLREDTMGNHYLAGLKKQGRHVMLYCRLSQGLVVLFFCLLEVGKWPQWSIQNKQNWLTLLTLLVLTARGKLQSLWPIPVMEMSFRALEDTQFRTLRLVPAIIMSDIL